jgi:hypothetical protein
MLELSELSIINRRKLKWMPPHFHSFVWNEVDYLFLSADMENWIDYKLTGRYSIVQKPNKNGVQTIIGFEDAKELTYFMLACPFKN